MGYTPRSPQTVARSHVAKISKPFKNPQCIEVNEVFFALAVLLIHPQANLQMGFSAEKIALFQPVNSSVASSSSFIEISHPLTRVSSDVSTQPPPLFDSLELPTAPEPASVNGPTLN